MFARNSDSSISGVLQFKTLVVRFSQIMSVPVSRVNGREKVTFLSWHDDSVQVSV